MTQGSAVATTITAALVSGTTQAVSYSVSGLPAGATATFSPTACTPTCTTTVTIATTTSTPAGTSTITVTGTGGGLTRTTSFSLSVTVTTGSSLSGTVRDAGTSLPVASASLQLKQAGVVKASAVSTSPGGTYSLTTTSLPDGSYELLASKTGYVTGSLPISLTAGSQTQDVSLTPGVWLSGMVTDAATGAPVASASVQLWQAGLIKASAGSTVTGSYTFTTTLPAGAYDLAVSKSGYATELLSGLALTAGANTQDVSLSAGTLVSVTLAGTTTDAATGLPLGSVSVQLVQLSSIKVSAYSSATGAYTLSATVPVGLYALKAVKAGYQDTLHVLPEITGPATLHQDLALITGVALRGTVRDCVLSAPLSGALFQLKQAGLVKASASSLTDGTYSLATSLPSGTYDLLTSKSGFATQTFPNLVLTAATPALRDVSLCPSGGVSLSGTVTDALRGGPLASVSLQLQQAGLTKASTVSSATGTYLFATTLPEGTYDLLASKGGYMTQTLAGLALSAATTTTQNLALAPVLQSGVTIYGTIRDTGGAPLASATVQLAQAGLVKATTSTQADGGYLLTTTLANGTYDLVLSKLGYVSKTTSGLSLTSSPTRQDGALTLAVAVTGTVTDALTKTPLAAATLQLKQAGIVKASTSTTTTGTYTLLTSLPAGSYELAVSKAGYLPASSTSSFVAGSQTRDVSLAPGVWLSGTVTDAATSTPIASALVQLKQSGIIKASVYTTTTGAYTMTTSLPAGTYDVVVSKTGAVTRTLTGLSLAAGPNTRDPTL